MENPSVSPTKQATKKCAIYVRKSSEKGLNQDFNSLQAQHEVCSAYIASQRHKGWIEAPRVYEDPGVSGATLERPAIQELLIDIEKGLVNVVVIYKLDRISRSLLDFVRLIEAFEKCGVSFVCITQNFDTSESIGRLVMNVLITFAQFERELDSERIRDKKRLMTAKGMWSGGRTPLGYDLVAHRLVINDEEAALVRHIYGRYAALRSMKAVARECAGDGLISKVRRAKDGTITGGCLLSIGTVRSILRNPIYVGELKLGKETCRGLHRAIVPAALWIEAKRIREEQIRKRVTNAPEDLLGGLTYDCYGRRMEAARRYLKNGWVALYTSFQTEWGRTNRVKRLRVNAGALEQLVLSAIHNLLNDRPKLRSIMIDLGFTALDRANIGAKMSRRLQALSHAQLRCALHTLIEHIEVARDRVILQLRAPDVVRLLHWDGLGFFTRDRIQRRLKLFHVDVPCFGVARLERRLRLPIDTQARRGLPNERLVSLMREARAAQAFVDEHRNETGDELAAHFHRPTGYFMRLLSLNYLAPDIVGAILDGTQPSQLKRKQLLGSHLPLEWALQRELFGFPEQPPMRTCEKAW